MASILSNREIDCISGSSHRGHSTSGIAGIRCRRRTSDVDLGVVWTRRKRRTTQPGMTGTWSTRDPQTHVKWLFRRGGVEIDLEERAPVTARSPWIPSVDYGDYPLQIPTAHIRPGDLSRATCSQPR